MPESKPPKLLKVLRARAEVYLMLQLVLALQLGLCMI